MIGLLVLSSFKEYRLRVGLTQSQVANALEIHKINVSRWETGGAAVPTHHMRKLEELFLIPRGSLSHLRRPFDSMFHEWQKEELGLRTIAKVSKGECNDVRLNILTDYDQQSRIETAIQSGLAGNRSELIRNAIDFYLDNFSTRDFSMAR